MSGTLRTFIREVFLTELRRDDRFLAHLRVSGLGDAVSIEDAVARHVANEWIDDVELELGHPISSAVKGQVYKFVARRWKGILVKFRGDHQAARQTLENLLNAKYSEVRMGD